MRTALYFAAPLLALGLAACGSKTDAPAPAATGTAEASGPAAMPSSVTPDEAKKVAHDRHEGFETIGKSMKTVMDQMKSGSPDMTKIQDAAATINRLAPQVSGWFPVGSGPHVIPKTQALPAIWQKPTEFSAAAQKLVDEAGSFNRIAQSGDAAAIGGGLKALGGACKGCHDQFKKPEKD